MNFLQTCFEIITILLLIKSLSTISSIQWWFWPESIPMMIAKWWFFNTVFPSSSINYFPLVELPFSLLAWTHWFLFCTKVATCSCHLFWCLNGPGLGQWEPLQAPPIFFHLFFFYSRILLVIYFKYSRVYMSTSNSQSIPPSILPPYSFDISS